jgi:16S rRNA (guanine527-N7)-methyltransferase
MSDSFVEAYKQLASESGLPPELAPVFAAWHELLCHWNAKVNLTRVVKPRRAVAYHLADAVPLAKALPREATLLDIGSGPGVPGLVVAALRPDARVTCAESRVKKAAFLGQAVAAMGLKNVQVRHERAENLVERFDVVTARAVVDPAELARRFGHLLAPGGQLAVFLSAHTERSVPAGYKIVQDISYSLPADEGDRRLVLVKSEK